MNFTVVESVFPPNITIEFPAGSVITKIDGLRITARLPRHNKMEAAFRVGLGEYRPGDIALLLQDDDDTDTPVVVEEPDERPEG